MKPPLRTKSVGTKVSEEEFAALDARARTAGLTLSEWVLKALLAEPGADRVGGELGGDPGTEVILADMLRWDRKTAGTQPENTANRTAVL